MIYTINAGTLYRVTETGEYTELNGGWGATTLMTNDIEHLYIICSGTLYKVKKEDGSYIELCGGWGAAISLTYFNNFLYCAEGGSLYKIDVTTGKYDSIGAWDNTTILM